MVNIYIQDSGRLKIPYAVETPFTTELLATQTQKRAGEFTVNNPVLLKITAFNFSFGNTTQNSSGGSDRRLNLQKVSLQPIQFTLTCTLDKPKNVFLSGENGDLVKISNLTKMIMSNGYKQLWIEDETDVIREGMFSFYELVSSYGVDDESLVAGTTVGAEKKHLKVSLDGYTHNEGVEDATYQLNFTLLWDFA